MAARNEAGYIEATLRSLIEEGLDVVLIDHGSVDGTRELAEPFLGGGLLQIRDVAWRGIFDLAEILSEKQAVYGHDTHDWQMHLDADEWPRANQELTMAQFLDSEVDSRCAVVNFREFIFLPPSGVDMWGREYRRLATRYYLFEPRRRRRMRAWRRNSVGSNVALAGDGFKDLSPDLVHPDDLTLRHYIGLSWSHAIAKRANRSYPPANLARGWHGNRLDLRAARPVMESPYVKDADPWDTRTLDASSPTRFHFWQRAFHEPIEP